MLGKGAVIIGALALFCYIALEVSMTTWSKPYMTELLGGKDNPTAVANAGFVLSLFGVAMTAGRFATSMVKNLTAIGVRLIALMALVAICAIAAMITTSSAASGEIQGSTRTTSAPAVTRHNSCNTSRCSS